MGVSLGLLLTGLLVATVDRLGCEPVADKVRILGSIAPAGLMFGSAFALAGLIALRLRARPVVAVILGAVAFLAGWFLTIVAGGLLFQGVSCAYVP
jgi:formate/nitrite transporter FocA (FNT family)